MGPSPFFAIVGALGILAALFATFAARAFGRFLAARQAGVKVEKLIIGAGYSLHIWEMGGQIPLMELRAFPFFVRLVLAGMSAGDEAAPGTFVAATGSQRFFVVLAGLVSVYLLAFGGTFLAQVGGGREVPTTQVGVRPGGAAEQAGMRKGDRIKSGRTNPSAGDTSAQCGREMDH